MEHLDFYKEFMQDVYSDSAVQEDFREEVERIKSFTSSVEGKYDDLPESAFYMVGTIDEAVEKARKLAAEAA